MCDSLHEDEEGVCFPQRCGFASSLWSSCSVLTLQTSSGASVCFVPAVTISTFTTDQSAAAAVGRRKNVPEQLSFSSSLSEHP